MSKTTSWEESIEDVLERLGRATGASRVYIFENHLGEDGEVWGTQRYEWVAPGVSAQMDNPLMEAIPYRAAGYGRWLELLGRGESVYGHTREFPEVERPELKAQDILSIAVVPIFVEERWWGQIGFDECARARVVRGRDGRLEGRRQHLGRGHPTPADRGGAARKRRALPGRDRAGYRWDLPARRGNQAPPGDQPVVPEDARVHCRRVAGDGSLRLRHASPRER